MYFIQKLPMYINYHVLCNPWEIKMHRLIVGWRLCQTYQRQAIPLIWLLGNNQTTLLFFILTETGYKYWLCLPVGMLLWQKNCVLNTNCISFYCLDHRSATSLLSLPFSVQVLVNNYCIYSQECHHGKTTTWQTVCYVILFK